MKEVIREIGPSELELLDHISGLPPYEVSNAAPLEDIKDHGPRSRCRIRISSAWGSTIWPMPKSPPGLKRKRFPSQIGGVLSKRVNRATDPGDGIPSTKRLTSQLDYEAELAVILKKDAKDVALEDVEDYIFGYTIMNDVSAREVQTAHRQWYFGKSLDGLRPWGPGSSPPTAWNFRRSSRSSPGSTENCARIPTRISSFTGSQKWSVS